jgi:CheY-like chemotaxis protein
MFLGVPGQLFPVAPSDQVRMAIFIVVGIIVSGVCEALLRAREHVEVQARELQTDMRARRAALEHWRSGMTLIAMTGRGRDEDRQRARDAGFDLHAVKPLVLERLQMLLASLVGPSAA